MRKLASTLDIADMLAMEEEKIRIQGAMDREDARFRDQCRELQNKKFALLEQKKLRLTHEQISEPQFLIRWNLER
jgi:hypothetical protein